MTDDDKAHGGALGDTEEVHDTIHPGDLPLGHPGRAAAEKLAETEEDEEAGVGGVESVGSDK